ncbi:hypothetical protein D0C36_00980 [Mucilaginibacter conchicola]|uniref:DUF2268 domain-containing protein n=1 Tax=Mucilaginibacter conchicola TaxID=2303333 RepID=A0A372NWD3_9SPHI|nr:Ig-like domain-containing protein [Mucilaginibacter conchicola]RFZ94161.1 hypothetical protein D0C36_00980 [Mucilaginibacter conchicola]
MKKLNLLLFLFILCMPLAMQAQQRNSKIVYTSDIDNFWQAYDSLATVSDTAKQVDILQKLYVDRGTPGLKAFMKARDYDARLWIKLIHQYPAFWKSIRKNTLSVKQQVVAIERSVEKFRKLYPELKPAKMYFTIGGLRSGGTTTDDMVLVGAEIATADGQTNASELSDWLKGVFKNQQNANLVGLNVHEYVHTQQKSGDTHILLSQAIMEGAADFIAELVTGRLNKNAYMIYGREHEAELKEKFKLEMFGSGTQNWLYNGSGNSHADLGYFMGYAICKAYYNSQPNKKRAIKNIIELDYTNEDAVTAFLKQSGYYKELVDKQQLLIELDKLRPVVVSLYPDINGQKDVSADLKELTIKFSQPMGEGYSINLGEGGREHFPLSGVNGFSDDRKAFKLKMDLKPGTTYDFIITDRSFKSKDGYPLKPYTVHFEVK